MSSSSTMRLGAVGASCPNAECAYAGRADGRIVKFGKSRQGRQWYRCAHCGKCFCERTHLTMRQFNTRLVRQGLGFSKALSMHRLAAALEEAVYNLVRPLKTLCQPA